MKKPITLLFLVVAPLSAHAASEQDQLFQLQKQFEQDQVRQKELEDIWQEQKKIEAEELESQKKEAEETAQNINSGRCFLVKKISFSANKIISKFREKTLTKNYLEKCLTLGKISELNQNISNYLVEEGYATSSSAVSPQNLESGVLKIEITESTLEKIVFNEEKFSDKTQKFTAFGLTKENEILNLKKIEQGLDQINRLYSNNAVIKIIPSEQKNSSIISLENHPHNSSNVNLVFDNYGSSLTGSRRETASFSQDNLFHLNDNLSLSRTANDLDANRKDAGSNSFSSSFCVPFTWYNLTLSYSKSSYFLHVGDITPSKSHGETSTKSIALDATLLKRKKFKLASNFNLSQRYNQSFTNDAKDQASSRKASLATFGISATFFFNNSSLFLKPSLVKSLNIFDAKKDSSTLDRSAAHAEFRLLKFYGNYSHRFALAQTPINYGLTFDSQFSNKTLYGNDRFSVGGVYSVRGFRDGSVSFDSGYSIKNEININLGRAILPYLNQEKISPFLGQLNRFYMTPFYDYGFSTANEQKAIIFATSDGLTISRDQKQRGRLSGAGLKLGFNHQYFNATLTFANAISKSQHLLQNHGENSAIYFNLASNFGF